MGITLYSLKGEKTVGLNVYLLPCGKDNLTIRISRRKPNVNDYWGLKHDVNME